MRPVLRCILLAITCIVALSQGGCFKSPPSNFYILNPLFTDNGPLPRNEPVRDVIIGVGPVNIPKYLDRSRLVYKTQDPHMIEIAEFDLWAGSLKEDLAVIISENLSTLLNSNNVVIFPWRTAVPVDYHVVIDVVRFEGTPSKTVTLSARWSIFTENGKNLVTISKSEIAKPIAEEGLSHMVAAQSMALAELSRDIAILIIEIVNGQ